MSNRGKYVRQAATLVIALSCIALSSLGGADTRLEKRKPAAPIPDEDTFFRAVPKAVCGPGDKPETALQGQVPKALRDAGFQGFRCNLQLLGQLKGEGANWQSAEWREGRGKNRKVCAYHGTAHPTLSGPGRVNLGVRVIDITEPTKPFNTAYLQTTSMLDPWESLKINERRQLLGAVNAMNGNGPLAIDIYDVSGDCRYPQLLSSTSLGQDPSTGLVVPGITGHEGTWSTDGLTYYGRGNRNYYAIDTTNTLAPKLISVWQPPSAASSGHGMSISDDNTRGYFIASAQIGGPSLTDPAVPAANGLLIYDLTDIQNRRGENPQPRLVSELYWKDGAVGQHTIPITIGNKKSPYLIHVDEAGSGGFASDAQFQTACAAGLTPFPYVRIIDISDETKPVIVSRVRLETHDPANCDKVAPDVAGLLSFTYGSHYCSVDNRTKATTLACGYFNSGIRVFDIRDPYRPREIAYYNPPTTDLPPGSNHSRAGGWVPGSPDWCASSIHLDAEQGTVWTTCQDNGLLTLKFTHNAWPFAETRTPPGRQTN